MAEEKMGFFKRLVSGLTKTRDNIVSGMDSIFHGFSKIDEEFYEELEEILIMGDLGVKATYAILDDLRRKVKEQHIKEPLACRQLLIDSIKEQMNVGETAYEVSSLYSHALSDGLRNLRRVHGDGGGVHCLFYRQVLQFLSGSSSWTGNSRGGKGQRSLLQSAVL